MLQSVWGVFDDTPAARGVPLDAVTHKFKSRFYPNDTEYTHGPYTPSSPTAVRFSGRQIRMRVEGDTPYAAWRVGTMRVDAKAGGRR